MPSTLLPPEETLALICRYQQGDRDAAERLLEHNRGLVYRVAHAYLRHAGCLEFEDLVSEGQLGLLRAARTYDPQRGAFSTYATVWIRQRIGHALRTQAHLIRTSDAAAPRVASLDEPLGEGADLLADLVEDPDSGRWEERALLRASVAAQLARLPEVERVVIERRFGLGGRPAETLAQVGALIGKTREGVRLIEAKALKRLRKRRGGLRGLSGGAAGQHSL